MKLLIVGLILLLDTFDAQPCANWIRRPNSSYSYLFCNVSVSIGSARRHCQKEQGYLTDIRSSEELRFIRGCISNYNVSFWAIGLSDWEEEGRWLWEDGTPFNSTVLQWDNSQPNNGRPIDCVEYRKSDSRLNDFSCFGRKCFVCRTEINGLPFFVASQDREINSEAKNWHDSAKVCQNRGWTLATITSQQDLSLFRQTVSQDNSSCDRWWIGLERTVADKWRWLNLDELDPFLLQWGSGQPSGNYREDCASLNTDGRVGDYGCRYDTPYICKRTHAAVADYHPDYCTIVVIILSTLLTLLCIVTTVLAITWYRHRRREQRSSEDYFTSKLRYAYGNADGEFSYTSSRTRIRDRDHCCEAQQSEEPPTVPPRPPSVATFQRGVTHRPPAPNPGLSTERNFAVVSGDYDVPASSIYSNSTAGGYVVPNFHHQQEEDERYSPLRVNVGYEPNLGEVYYYQDASGLDRRRF